MTKVEAKNIKDLVTFMKANKVQHFKAEGIEVLFSSVALYGGTDLTSGKPGNPSLDLEPKPSVEDIYQDPMLYASSE